VRQLSDGLTKVSIVMNHLFDSKTERNSAFLPELRVEGPYF
jgi:hypothetical protein